METIRRINYELAIAGSVTCSELQQIAEEGFRSVLNLRSLNQPPLDEDQQQVESLGLCYVNVPIDIGGMNPEIAVRVLKQIDPLPKPTLVYCKNATLAAAMVLMYIATSQGQSLHQAFKRAEGLGLFRSYAQL